MEHEGEMSLSLSSLAPLALRGVSIAVRFLCAASYKARANGIAQQPIFNSGGKWKRKWEQDRKG